MSYVEHPSDALAREGKKLNEFCLKCVKTRVAAIDGPIAENGIPLFKKGDFVIDCKGIPAENKYIPRQDYLLAKIEKDSGEKISDAELRDLTAIYDAVTWAEKYLGWKPRKSIKGEEYQANILRCSGKRKVLRCGRRLGKSEVMLIWALFRLFNNSPKEKRWDEHTKQWVRGMSKILFLAPYLSQVKDFFTRLKAMIEANPELNNEIESFVATPYYKVTLKSGMVISGFSAGSAGASSVRGQPADFIILDEMDYLKQEDIETVMALLMEHNDVEMITASTPSGRREYFYDFCTTRMDFKEFFYPSMANPSWSPRMEAELRATYRTEIGWQHEILAEFGEAATSVFQFHLLERAMSSYKYEDCRKQNDLIYSMGIDWNDVENGTKIRVVEFNPATGKIKCVASSTIQKAGWVQTSAVNEAIRMNRIWNCNYIYVDCGYGATQIELLRKIGQDAGLRKDQYAHLDMNFINTKGINFSSTFDVFDPISGLPNKMKMKPFLVESTVRFFERGMVEFSSEDEILLKQLHGYNIARITQTGVPVYESGPAGDHDLDAFMLALLALEVELGEYTKQHYTGNIALAGALGQPLGSGSAPAVGGKIVSRPETRSDIGGKVGKSAISFFDNPMINRNAGNTRIYSREAFNNDDRSTRQTTRQSIQQARNSRQISRRLF
jgi:replicative DNA helicase